MRSADVRGRSGRDRRVLATALVLVLALQACSSTTKRADKDEKPDGYTLPAVTDSAVAGDGSSITGRRGERTAEERLGKAATQKGGAADPAAITRSGPLAGMKGTITIGFVTWKPTSGTLVGYAFDFPDSKPVIEAAVAEINAHGGIAGRRVRAAIVEFDIVAGATDQAQSARLSNEACVSLTEDHHSFLVISLIATTYLARGCYAEHETPVFANELFEENDFRELKPWLLPSLGPNLTRSAGFVPVALRDQGFMSKRMGVFVINNLPSMRRTADRILIPKIESLGGRVIETFYSDQMTVQEWGTDIASAVLLFNSRGIDRVVFWAWGADWAEFAKQAQAQRYFPRYGIHSLLAPNGYSGDAPPDQRRRTVAAGWAPGVDVPDEQFPLTDRERACLEAINRRAGTRFSQRSVALDAPLSSAAIAFCQYLNVTKAALAPTAGKALGQGQVWGLFHALGDEPPVVTPPQTRFAPDKWDGSRYYAHLAYTTSCSCFRYTTGWKEISAR